jgi:parvulin-like peptidyl-prolyl isomerase
VKGELIPEYDQISFKLATGQVSEVFQTRFGYHLIKCEQHQREEKPTFEGMKARIREKILAGRARDQELEYATKVEWLLRRDKDLRRAASAAGHGSLRTVTLERGRTPPVGLSRTAVGMITGELSALEPGETTRIIETDEGFFIARLVEEHYVRAPEAGFLKERAEVEAALLARKQRSAVESWLAALRARAKVRIFIDAG